MNYSSPIDLNNVSLKVIKKYLNYDKSIKNAIPYITSYYKKKLDLIWVLIITENSNMENIFENW